MFLKSLLFFCLIIPQFFCWGQAGIYKVFNITNGLPSNVIYHVTYDSNGYLWLAHSKGLSRLSSNAINNYYSNSNQGSSVSNILFYNNTVYCQEFSGNFYHLKYDSLKLAISSSNSSNFYNAHVINNELVFLRNNSINFFNAETNTTYMLPCKENIVTSAPGENNKLLILGESTVMQLNGRSGLVPLYKNKGYHFLVNTSKGLVGVIKNKYPFIYNVATQEVIKNNLPKNTFVQNISITNEEIWICTAAGAYGYDKNLQPLFNAQCQFKNQSISSVVKAKDGGYYFSSTQKGLFYVPFSNVNLVHTEYSITAVKAFNNELFFGTQSNELLQLNSKTKYTGLSTHSLDNIFMYNQTIFTCSDVLSILKNGKYNIISNTSVKDIYSFNDNHLLATSAGLYLYNTQESSLPNYFELDRLTTRERMFLVSKTNKRCRAVYFNQNNKTIYVSTVDGLEAIGPKNKSTILYNSRPIYVSAFYHYVGAIYVNTINNGICLLENNTLKPLINLKHKVISYALFSDGNIWYIANNQLYCYALKYQKTESFYYLNNVLNADLRALAICNNTLYVGTDKGLLNFRLTEKFEPLIRPKLLFNRMLVNSTTKDYFSSIALHPKENNVAFEFCSNAYTASDSLKFWYKINNQNWVQSSSKNKLEFNELSSGNYSIQLKSIDENGVESSNVLQWDFSIKEVFYKEWWFLGLLFLISIALVVVYFKNIISKKEKNNKLVADKLKLEEALQRSMMASINSQMNPHFLFNALNTIQSYIYTNDKVNATQYLSKFSKLTRKILEMSNKATVLLSEEIEALTLYIELEKTRFEDKLQYQLHIDKDLNTESTYIPSMLVQPYVENAIKHGLLHKKDNRLLQVNFLKDNDTLIIRIEDNGVGRKKSAELNAHKQHQSFAMNANIKRLEILKKSSKIPIAFEIIDKENSNKAPLGTTVVIKLPLQATYT